MRLLIFGNLGGQMASATRMAMERGAKVMHADDQQAALDALRGGKAIDLVMVDVAENIKTLIQAMEREHISAPVIACGVKTDADAAVKAIKDGAREYIPLPPDPALIAAVIAAVTTDELDLISTDPAMTKVIKLAEQIAPSDASCLITGESGTGKEVMARYVHAKSNRSGMPFVSVNCAAIPENLLESELFGHEKGAFTGALARRIGKFEEASGGTLLLDEISEMDVRLQAKLLRALQERVIDRVGGAKPVPVDLRIIATSNRSLTEEVNKGTFREDLLFRLNVVNLALPALRERPADILALSDHFAKKYAKANGFPWRPVSEPARTRLMAAPWRGNVRELENTIHRAVLLASGPEIGPEALITPDGSDFAVQSSPSPSSAVQKAAMTAEAVTRALVGRTVAEVEQELILDTLDHCLGNRTHAATILGISIRTLRNKLNDYTSHGVPVPQPGQARVMHAG